MLCAEVADVRRKVRDLHTLERWWRFVRSSQTQSSRYRSTRTAAWFFFI